MMIELERRSCACACGCDYRIDDYAPNEWACGACVNVCMNGVGE